MIKVENLHKRYAGFAALKGISFEVQKGEIVGFLGPNGAGKSTTMRILSGFFPASAGRASINGFDVFSQSLDARRHLGYMPENVPLYTDMRVNEYLSFRARLKGVPGRRIRERMDDVLDLCGLAERRKSIIGTLSKGFRQRVGLADALIHDPDLLILDEPTIGLDPNQIRQVRDLIRHLGKRHTILLSSHILPEVEATCSRVIILNKGKIEAVDTPENLRAKMQNGETVLLVLSAPVDPSPALRGLPGVHSAVAEEKSGRWNCTISVEPGTMDLRPALASHCIAQKWELYEMHSEQMTLEDIFTEVTHKGAKSKEGGKEQAPA